jgi:hypothetical protein
MMNRRLAPDFSALLFAQLSLQMDPGPRQLWYGTLAVPVTNDLVGGWPDLEGVQPPGEAEADGPASSGATVGGSSLEVAPAHL